MVSQQKNIAVSQSLTIPLSASVKMNKNVMIIICIVSRNNWAGEAPPPYGLQWLVSRLSIPISQQSKGTIA